MGIIYGNEFQKHSPDFMQLNTKYEQNFREYHLVSPKGNIKNNS